MNIFLSAALLLAAPVFSSDKEAWNAANDPLRLYGSYERTLSALPLSGNLERKPWSDTYWPSNAGGLAQRWRTGEDSFTYTLASRDEVFAMSTYQLSRLSPAEKFDLYARRYEYPFVQRERRRTRADMPSWYGLCHGWAAASVNFDEPHAALVTNADGLAVPFGASDVKALLEYYQGEVGASVYRSLGSRCNADINADPNRAQDPECRDVNAGSFHVVITNQIGTLKEPFIADIVRDQQVWNHPVFAFTTRVLGYQDPTAGAAPGTVKEARIETRMTYGAGTSAHWRAIGERRQPSSSRTYRYRVELNAAGQIIGGDWDGTSRPDFLWKQSRPRFAGSFAPLAKIYDAATTGPILDEPQP